MVRKIIFLLLLFSKAGSQSISFPLRAGESKKYLVDQNNKPVFLNGTASWRLSYAVTYKEATDYLTDRKAKGYNSLIVEITPDLGNGAGGNQPNLYGEYCFTDADISKPNEKFFTHVDSILQLCNQLDFAVLLSPLYLGCCHDGWLEILQKQPNTVEKCREYGKWVARRYSSLPNIIWISGGDHNETPESIAFAEGIAAVDTTHLHSYHTDPGYTSFERLPNASWLTMSCAYTYFPVLDQHWQYYHVYAQLYMESRRNNRIPYILFESAYEYERNETTQFLRRQAYWALLSGASGHIFGNRDTWMMNKNWPNALHTPGNESMQLFYSFVKAIPWHRLLPDWQHTVFTAGRGSFNATQMPGGEEYATAAFSKEDGIGIIYLPTYRTVTANMERFKSPVSARWFDPSGGKYVRDPTVYPNKNVAYFTPPSRLNSKGFDDWVLILESRK